MGITPYKIGDELGIERTEEFEQDWCPLISEDLLRGESYTYRIGNDVKFIISCSIVDGYAEVYFIWDRRNNSTLIKQVKKMLDYYVKKFDTVYTSSIASYRNNKFHKLIGFVFLCKDEGRIIWEKSLRV